MKEISGINGLTVDKVDGRGIHCKCGAAAVARETSGGIVYGWQCPACGKWCYPAEQPGHETSNAKPDPRDVIDDPEGIGF